MAIFGRDLHVADDFNDSSIGRMYLEQPPQSGAYSIVNMCRILSRIVRQSSRCNDASLSENRPSFVSIRFKLHELNDVELGGSVQNGRRNGDSMANSSSSDNPTSTGGRQRRQRQSTASNVPKELRNALPLGMGAGIDQPS